jgi:hypothetical protein
MPAGAKEALLQNGGRVGFHQTGERMSGVCRAGVRPLSALSLLCLVVGCASTTDIKTNKAKDYATEPKRIFVTPAFGNEFYDQLRFNSTFLKAISDCGAVAEIVPVNPLALDDKKQAAAIQKFNPDAIMSIAGAGFQTKTTGSGFLGSTTVSQINYNIELFDVASKRTVWKATVILKPHQKPGDAFAIDLTNRMKADGIFQSCPQIKQ